MVRQRGSTWSSNRPTTSPSLSTPTHPFTSNDSHSSSLAHIMKRTYSQVFSTVPHDFASEDPLSTKGKERASFTQKDRKGYLTPASAKEGSTSGSLRGLARRASMSLKKQLQQPHKLLKETPARDSSQSIPTSSNTGFTSLPERRRPSFSQQIKGSLKNLRRHAVSNQSGEEGRWNPTALPLPVSPSSSTSFPTALESRHGHAARTSAAAHNIRFQYGGPSNSPLNSPFEGSECDSIMGNTDSPPSISMTRQDSVDSLEVASQGLTAPIVRLGTSRTAISRSWH